MQLQPAFQACPQKVGRGNYWAANENFYCSITALLHWFLYLQIVSFYCKILSVNIETYLILYFSLIQLVYIFMHCTFCYILFAVMESFLFSAKWNYPKEKDILHTLLRRILSPWGAFLRLKQRLRFDDKSIVTRKVKLSKTAKNAILAEFRNRKSYLFPIKNRNDMRNAPWHDLRGVFPFFIAIIRSVRSSSELPLWYKYREDGFPSDLRLWYGQTLLFRAVRGYSRIRSSPYLSGYRRPAGRSCRKPFPCKEHGLQRPREQAS